MVSRGFGLSRRLAQSAVAFLFIAASATIAAESINRSRSGLALDGYDPVAYVTAGQPTRGEQQFAYQHEGTTYHFASVANRDVFAKNPAQYLPQYGGFCAWAVSRGYTAKTDPLAWKVVGGRLYLNYSTSVQKKWEEDVPGNIQKADGNWPALSKK